MWALSTCGEPYEIKKIPTRKMLSLLVCWPRDGVGRVARVEACSQKRAVMCFGWVFFLISLGGQAPHVRPMWALSTCGEPNGIELTPIWVESNGSRRAPATPTLDESGW